MKFHYSPSPAETNVLGTEALRSAFLIGDLFQPGAVTAHYTDLDRMIVGAAVPTSAPLALPNYKETGTDYFLERREIGIINVGGTGEVTVDGTTYSLETKEALYIGRGVKEVVFHPGKAAPALYYINSAPAHHAYPTRKVSLQEAETVEIGSPETSNHRTIRKLLVNSVLETCQLQMGLTDLRTGSVWNTMPPHTHDRRMEAYFYFNIPDNQVVCHFMGPADETRHLWVKNNQAVISPPWSIHSGAGTANYTFIWGMAGENMDYSDMDGIKPTELK